MFELISNFVIEAVYRPIFNLVVITYNLSPGPNFGLAIIGIALLIRFIFLYFTLQSYKHDEQLEEVKPLIKKVEEDPSLSPKEKINKISRITQPLGINPVFSSLPLFAQLVFLGVLYQIIQGGINRNDFHHLYSFVSQPGTINTLFLGFDLSQPSIILATIAVLILLVELVWDYNTKREILTSVAQRWGPLIWSAASFIILLILPSAKAIFLMTSVLFSLTIKSIVHFSRG
jgi:membrane protein insertase Oxa1/YidC/SpoIIIJ